MRNMTEGSITKHVLSYAIPTILGNLLQLTYNAIDSIIVGKCAGDAALAAVSVSNPIMTIIILGVSGISLGASVLMSQFYGAGEYRNLKRELSTTLLAGGAICFFVFVLGIVFSRQILELMAVPEEAINMAVEYLRIVFAGFLFTFIFNVMSAALRSVGDASTPVIFLGIAAVLNACLDYVFIKFLDMGVAGAAFATVAAEVVSAILCMIWVYKTQPALSLGLKELVIDKHLLKETMKSGSLTAFQQAGMPIGKVLIQSVINMEGVAAIAAFNAVCRMDDFACIPSQSIGHSIMTVAAQNQGAGHTTRVRESFKKGLLIALIYFPIICIITLVFKEPFVKLLAPKGSAAIIDSIIGMGVYYLSVKAWFFIMPCILNSVQGYYRGLNKMNIALAATLTQISIRTVIVFLIVPKFGIIGEAYACLAGWLCQMLFEYTLYFSKYRKTEVIKSLQHKI